MHWTTPYIGKPWESGKSGPHAYDCWGLVRAVYQDQKGITLPEVNVPHYSEAVAAYEFVHNAANDQWHATEHAAEWDLLLFHKGSWPVHIGVWVPELKRVLHSWQGAGVVLTELVALRRLGMGNIKTLRYHGSVSGHQA